ncbi:MAG TPA: HAMP domain-containing sensor histidine kinase [Candidatus Acidoferrales bacterium]|nr:HAMP domain-containing sensor histidine kinase [Candidatus Acidoferrales bacterium]
MNTTGAMRAPCSASLPAIVRQVVNELATLIAQRRAVVEIGRTAEAPLVRGPEQSVKQIVYQVLRNAVEASPPGGVIRVAQHERDGQVILEISDDGSGIQTGDFSKILKRGFTTKSGTKGQGLAEVECRIAELRGGIAWESPLRSGRGTCFTITLPSAQTAQAVQAPA